jgi:hypothetical protein
MVYSSAGFVFTCCSAMSTFCPRLYPLSAAAIQNGMRSNMQSKYLGNKGSMGKKEIEEIEEGLPFSPGFVLSHFCTSLCHAGHVQSGSCVPRAPSSRPAAPQFASSEQPVPPPRQFQNAVPELFTDLLYVFRALGGTPAGYPRTFKVAWRPQSAQKNLFRSHGIARWCVWRHSASRRTAFCQA